MYCVYWISKNKNEDVMTNGYIGITKDLHERIRSHRRNKKVTKLTSFLKSISWEACYVEILDMNLSQKDACDLERYYRPQENIGLNHQRGGELGVNPEWYLISENKQQHSEATSKGTVKGILEKDSIEARRERAIKSRINNADSYKGIAAGSKNPKALLNENQVHIIKYDLIPAGLTNHQIADQFTVHPRVIQFIRIGKNWKHI